MLKRKADYQSIRGTIRRVEPYEAYVKYLALKSHFSDKNYDYIKYNGKVKAWRTTFETRKDKYFFYKLSKQKDPIEFLIANFVGNDDFYIGDIRDDKANEVYMDYKKRLQSLSYVFKSDLSKMKEDFNSNIIVPENVNIFQQSHHPKLPIISSICKNILSEVSHFLRYIVDIFDHSVLRIIHHDE